MYDKNPSVIFLQPEAVDSLLKCIQLYAFTKII